MKPSVIIAAYGPENVTLSAVRRARALTGIHGHIVVVAALPTATAAAARCAGIPGVRVVPGIGSEAYRSALAVIAGGPVLFIHDDILLTPPNLERMSAELARVGDGFVVPWSNDIGMDHFCGPLPSIRLAIPRLAERARGLGAVPPPRVVRPSCLLGDRTDFTRIGHSHLVDPRLKLDLIDLTVRIAPHAVVAHDSTCTASLFPPEGPEGRPLLVASMIVKDEEEMLPGLLESIAGLVDHTVICDTGSTDGTVAVAESFGATVIHREWRDDFSWARNECLIESEATGAWWLLAIDADDRVLCDDPVGLRRILATYAQEYEVFGVSVENRESPGGVSWSSFISARIHRATGRYRFVRPVHETLVDVRTGQQPRPPLLTELTVVHLGYQADIMATRKKAERNLRLTKKDFDENPTPKNALEYARAIKVAGGDRAESSRLMVGILAQLEEQSIPTEPNVGFIAFVLTSLAEDALILGDPASARLRACQVLDLVPADVLAARLHAEASLALGRPQDVVDMDERRRASTSVRPTFLSDPTDAVLRSMQAAAYARLGRLPEALTRAAEALAISPGHFASWADMVAALYGRLPPDEAEAGLLDLALADPTGGVFEKVVRGIAPAATASFCLAYCRAGGPSVDAVRVGFLAALVAGKPELFSELIPWADRLAPDVLAQIAQRAGAFGHPELAEALPKPAGASAPATGLVTA
jgi:hypothetical protein